MMLNLNCILRKRKEELYVSILLCGRREFYLIILLFKWLDYNDKLMLLNLNVLLYKYLVCVFLVFVYCLFYVFCGI